MRTSSKKSRPTLTVRELKPTEIQTIFPLVHLHNPSMTKQVFTRRLKQMMPLGYRAIAAFDGKTMVGVSGFWVRTRFWCGRQLDVDNFYIAEDYRRQGLGGRLIAWLEKKALEEDCALMVLDVYTDNNLAQRFYHREGFVITGYHFTKIPGTTKPYVPKNRKQA